MNDVSFLRSFGIMSLPALMLFSPRKKSVLPSSSTAVVHHRSAGSKKAAARCSSSSPSRGVVGVHRFFFVSPTTSKSSPKNKTLQHHRRGARVHKPRGEHSRNRALADDVTELNNAWSADEQKKAVSEILENVDDGGARKEFHQRFSCSFFFFLFFSLINAFVLVK